MQLDLSNSRQTPICAVLGSFVMMAVFLRQLPACAKWGQLWGKQLVCMLGCVDPQHPVPTCTISCMEWGCVKMTVSRATRL
jgi:hypothetical protein